MNDTDEKVQSVETDAEAESAILTDEEYYARVDEHLKLWQNDLAQADLDCVKEESGKKHYYQSKIYKQKRWYNEQRKELKAALKVEPDNEEYINEMKELKEFKKSGEYKHYQKEQRRQQMGGVWGDACAECCCVGSLECLCQGICEGLSGGC